MKYMDIGNVKKAHFIGIGGAGMSAVAKLLRDAGVSVTGSDEGVYPPISTLLEQEKISYTTPYASENISTDADLIVIGKNAKLVPETNAEVRAAYASGKKILSFPEVLADLSEGKENIIVAGSYGKSTCAALLSHILIEAKLDPSFFIGAVPISPATNAKLGKGDLFVMEGDEYPASNTDRRSKFLLMHPSHLLITPLAHDHFNIFPTPEDYIKPFEELANITPQGATRVVCTEGALSGEFLSRLDRPAITYGVHDGEFHAANIVWGERTSFEIAHNDASVVRVEMSQLGEHSIQNVVGVAAFLFSQRLVTPGQFANAVASFKGLKRRLDRKSDKTSIPIFEGFGSSYEKAKSAIAAMKRHFPSRRLLVIFEPNTISWRHREALHQYDDVFEGVSHVYIFTAPHDGKETQLSTDEIADRVRASGVPATPISEPEQLLAQLESDLQENDSVLLLSSGPLGGLVESIPLMAEKKFPK